MMSAFENPFVHPYILFAVYCLVIGYTIITILLETNDTGKTFAYILLVVAFPFVGLFIYYGFGANYRYKNLTKKRVEEDKRMSKELAEHTHDPTEDLIKNHPQANERNETLIRFIDNLGEQKLNTNDYKLLVNGEEKFPEVLKSLGQAEHFIHMEYYDWENDVRGNQIKDVLLQKVTEGVVVRVMFDDYASRKIKHNIVKELKKGGVQIHPVIKVRLKQFANRVNHRDHRQLIIIDGTTGFVGGINISDRYDNSIDTGLWWRDTHVKITGGTVLSMQKHFMVNWNTSQKEQLSFSKELFPESPVGSDKELAQIIAGGPIYPVSNIMLTYARIFGLARKKLYITNPYFIPNQTIVDVLVQAAITKVDVRLMVPYKSDSALVGAASKFYFKQLLEAGVKIFLYKKGFVHAKTVVADGNVSVVGTANMDIRSFMLNFEIMSIIYGPKFAVQLEQAYMDDLKECVEIDPKEWLHQSKFKLFIYSVARLMSSFL